MKPYLFSYFFGVLLAGMMLLSSCSDIIEPSISKSNVQPEAPSDGYQSTIYTINFWWDEVDHSLSYHLQQVTPSFASPGSLVLDTVVKKNTFSFTLRPGNYQWRVIAEKGKLQTAFLKPRGFSVGGNSI